MVYFSLGSNDGNRNELLNFALKVIDTWSESFVQVSSWFYSRSLYDVSQPDYINLTVGIKTNYGPFNILTLCQNLEVQLGRKRNSKVPRVQRTLDIDIIAYDQLLVHTPTLILPHPLATEREFVLRPLCELAGNETHPRWGSTWNSYLKVLRSQGLSKIEKQII